jgi:hypothetical protein
LTDKVNGSKFAANWPLERYVSWLSDFVGRQGWQFPPSLDQRVRMPFDEEVGVADGKVVHTIEVVAQGRYVHAYPVPDRTMAENIEISLDDEGDHVVDPPIIDLLYHEPAGGTFVVTFLPEEAVSQKRTESIHISDSSSEGKRIETWLSQLGELLRLPGPVAKVFHRGGGDFGFYAQDDAEPTLSSPELSNENTQAAYVALQDIAQIAQIAFLMSRRPSADDLNTLQPRPIAVELRNGRVLRGSAEGNNASWLCICRFKTPLLGTTRVGAGDTRCPNCGRIYRVFPYPHSGKPVSGVKEIESAKATA